MASSIVVKSWTDVHVDGKKIKLDKTSGWNVFPIVEADVDAPDFLDRVYVVNWTQPGTANNHGGYYIEFDGNKTCNPRKGGPIWWWYGNSNTWASYEGSTKTALATDAYRAGHRVTFQFLSNDSWKCTTDVDGAEKEYVYKSPFTFSGKKTIKIMYHMYASSFHTTAHSIDVSVGGDAMAGETTPSATTDFEAFSAVVKDSEADRKEMERSLGTITRWHARGMSSLSSAIPALHKEICERLNWDEDNHTKYRAVLAALSSADDRIKSGDAAAELPAAAAAAESPATDVVSKWNNSFATHRRLLENLSDDVVVLRSAHSALSEYRRLGVELAQAFVSIDLQVARIKEAVETARKETDVIRAQMVALADKLVATTKADATTVASK